MENINLRITLYVVDYFEFEIKLKEQLYERLHDKTKNQGRKNGTTKFI